MARRERIPGQWELVRDQHCQVYATLVAQWQQDSKSAPHHQIAKSFAADMENILVAWQWAVQQRNLEAIATMYPGLTDYFQLTSSFHDGQALFREALEALGWPEAVNTVTIPENLLTWELLSVQAMFSLYLGQLPQARDSLESCVAVFDHHGVRERVAHGQFFLGEIARFSGELDSAREFSRRSLANYQQVDDCASLGFCLNGLGLVSSALNELTQTRSYFRDSLAAFVKTSHEMGQAIVSINLADLLTKLKEHAAGREMLDKGFGLCQKLGHRWGMATCLRNLGNIARLEDRVMEAKIAYQESLEILQDIGQRQTSVSCLIKLSQVCMDLGEFTEARQHLKQGLAIADELQDETQMIGAAATLALLLASEGDKERALELAILVEHYPTEVPAAQERARQLIAEVSHQISEQVRQLVQRRSRVQTLKDMLAEAVFSLET